MHILLVEAVLESYNRVQDGSMKLKFGTMKEIDTKDLTLIDEYYRKQGFLAFKMDEIDIADIPQENTAIKGQKSQSQQLRLKLFALHMKRGGSKSDFTPFYDKAMNEFNLAIQKQLDDLEE